MSRSIGDILDKKISDLFQIDEEIVHTIIMHEKSSVRDAMKKYNSIEISGLGKFTLTRKHIDKRLKTLEDIQRSFLFKLEEETNEFKIATLNKRLVGLGEEIKFLKDKFYGFEENSRRI